MQSTFKSFVTLGALAAFAQSLDLQATQPDFTESAALPDLKANSQEVTISGMSAGAHFSCHLMIVMSDTFKGAGCAKGGAFMSRYAEFRDASTTR